MTGYELLAGDARLSGRLLRPEGEPRAAVLVVHDNKGVTPYVESVAAELAAQGYLVVAPDLLSRLGGTESFAGQQTLIEALGTLDIAELALEVRDTSRELVRTGEVPAGLAWGAVGFCFGGSVVWRTATEMPELKAAVPFYGKNPPLEDVPRINAPVLAVYGELDQRINLGIGAIETAMGEAGKTMTTCVFPGVGHAFHSPASPRHDPDMAALAWARALEWLDRWLAPGETTTR